MGRLANGWVGAGLPAAVTDGEVAVDEEPGGTEYFEEVVAEDPIAETTVEEPRRHAGG